ncbi:MAG TPA: GNAT family N-acetyltransferase [Candidatus Saccharimonadales bacterium]|nr:GNAT family N-acetyltransferase [Candidatus Saccharimonadales bacterium]
MPQSNIVIEPFDGNQKVADAVAKLHLEVRRKQRADGESDFHGRIRSSQADLKAMQDYYIEPGGNFFIAWEIASGEIAGFIGVKKIGGAEGQIRRMAVMPTYRRQGIGTRLARTAVAWAKDAGFRRLHVATGEKEKAIHIYKSAGFEEVGRDPKRGDILLSLNLT